MSNQIATDQLRSSARFAERKSFWMRRLGSHLRRHDWAAKNEQAKRNARRFPPDFLFQLAKEEAETELRSRSQIAILKQGTNVKYLPYAFTENGAIMAANVLNSPEAVRMSVFVVRAFVQMRDLLGSTKELAKQLAALEKKLTERLDGHEVAIIEVLRRVSGHS